MSFTNYAAAHTKSFLCATELAQGSAVKLVSAISNSNESTGGVALLDDPLDVCIGFVQKCDKNILANGTVVYRVTVILLGVVMTGISAKALSVGAYLTHEGDSADVTEGVGSSEVTLSATRLTDFALDDGGSAQSQFLGVALSSTSGANQQIDFVVPFGCYSRS